ncbi:hypothetical protein GTA07_10520, partial [Rhodococcus hoagii]|nr:hypothetical protein [Prescottella equi]
MAPRPESSPTTRREGRLITLSNEALWKNGSVEFTKFVFDGEDPVPATEADLPDGAAFE